jgi:hypothetical protein
MHEPAIIAKVIKERLQSDATIQRIVEKRVYRNLAPYNGGKCAVSYPFILFSLVSGGSDVRAGCERIVTYPLYQIVVEHDGIAPCSAREAIDTILGRIADLFDGYSETREGLVFHFQSEAALPEFYEIIGANPIYTEGRQYRVTTHKT